MKTLNELLDVNLSFDEVLENLSEQTDDFTLPEGEVAFDDQYEAEMAVSILERYYENVDNAGLDVLSDEDSAFVIKFSTPFVDDFDFPQEGVEESLNESLSVKNLLDILESNPIILLVDDINSYDGDWVNKEYAKDYWDEDDLEEDANEPNKREKITVSKEDIDKVIHNIQTSSQLKILNRAKNRALADRYNLSTEDQIDILRAISIGDYTYSTVSDNALNEGNMLTIFFKDVNLGDDKISVTLYIKVDDSVAGDVVIISLHEGKDRYVHPYRES